MLAIAPMDENWFNLLKSQNTPQVVKFWTPTPWNVRKLKDGDPPIVLIKSTLQKDSRLWYF
ncbi:hypothetical protein ACIQZM_20375 [Peribacillus sp. NPDC097206]|uniref:hypothetical protein n=1 Tax=unclassified Peribacillus TaxID=2675266 RepID=UPI0037F37DC1